MADDLYRLLLTFHGRIGRREYWTGFFILLAVEFGVMLTLGAFVGDRVQALFDVAFLYPELAVIIKRANDCEMESAIVALYIAVNVVQCTVVAFGWSDALEQMPVVQWALFGLWIAVSLYIIFNLGFRPGTSGPNRYGADPLSAKP